MVSTQSLQDIYLIGKVRRGDREVFSALYRRHSRRVYGMLYRLSSSVEVAEDLTQETFLSAFRSLDSYELRGSFSSWVGGIALRTYRGHVRNRKSQPETELLADDDLLPGSASDDPLAICTRRDAERALAQAILGLPTSAREVFVLVRVEGYSYQDAADCLEVPLGTVQSRLHRASQMLHRSLSYLLNDGPQPAPLPKETRHVIR